MAKRLFLFLFVAFFVAVMLPSSAIAISSGKSVLFRASKEIQVRETGDSNAAVVTTVPAGGEVVVLDTQSKGGWVPVHAVATGFQGWVVKSLLKGPIAMVYRPVVTTIEQLGNKDGVVFEGSEIAHMENFFFPVPKDSVINSGVFKFHYTFSPVLNRLSNVRIDVNEIPRFTSRLPKHSENQVVSVPLTAKDFSKGFVKISVRAALFVEEDRCLDERVNASFLHILPESAVHIAIKSLPHSIRGTWRMLPKKVVVSIPPHNISEAAYAAAWQVAELLIREGKDVKIVRLPEIGDIVVGRQADILGSLQSSYPNMGRQVDAAVPNRGFNLKLIDIKDKRFIAFSEPFNMTPLYAASTEWMNLLASEKYTMYPINEEALKGSTRYQIDLKALGLDTTTRFPSRKAEWRMAISPRHLPANYVPERLIINVVTTPTTGDNPVMLYVYLNELLQEVIKLPDDGLHHKFEVLLDSDNLLTHNEVVFSVQREKLEGDCWGSPDGYPVQILPSSALVVKKTTGEPKEFSDLRRYFGDGFDIYVADAARNVSDSSLLFLARLSADLAITVSPHRLKFIGDRATISPTSPFLLVGGAGAQFNKLPVRFDQGHVIVVDKKESVLLDIDSLPNISVAQIASVGDNFGLWVNTAGTGRYVASKEMHFAEDDVAFIDYQGVVLTIDSREKSLAEVHYPEYKNWLDVLGHYKLWIMAIGWVLVILFALFIYRVVAGHEDEEDDELDESGKEIHKKKEQD